MSVDAGKVWLTLPREAFDAPGLAALGERVGKAVAGAGLGRLVEARELDYEPYTPETGRHGRRWWRIELALSQATELRGLAALLRGAGVPGDAEITFTERMQLCGVVLARA